MQALDHWRRELKAESRARLRELIEAERYDDEDPARREALLDAFLVTLTETQLLTFARLLRELTSPMH